MMFDAYNQTLHQIAAAMTARGLFFATAESCTGGLIGAAASNVPGCSGWFRGGIIAYDNAVKTRLLGVPEDVIRAYGAVSHPTVRHMALGACEVLHTDLAVAVSGIAGPDGGTDKKPVGTVYIGLAWRGTAQTWRCLFEGDRDAVRQAAVREAFRRMQALLDSLPPARV